MATNVMPRPRHYQVPLSQVPISIRDHGLIEHGTRLTIATNSTKPSFLSGKLVSNKFLFVSRNQPELYSSHKVKSEQRNGPEDIIWMI